NSYWTPSPEAAALWLLRLSSIAASWESRSTLTSGAQLWTVCRVILLGRLSLTRLQRMLLLIAALTHPWTRRFLWHAERLGCILPVRTHTGTWRRMFTTL